MRSHSDISYRDAVRLVLSKDKKLLAQWLKADAIDPLEQLRSLAEFLDNGEGAERDELLSELSALMCWLDHSKQANNFAMQSLCAKLNAQPVHWNYKLTKEGRPYLIRSQLLFAPGDDKAATVPGPWYGIIATAAIDGNISKLKPCRQCGKYFVHHDHRRQFCNDKCFRSHETSRVRKWRKTKAR